jgi:hypothetical protein
METEGTVDLKERENTQNSEDSRYEIVETSPKERFSRVSFI